MKRLFDPESEWEWLTDRERALAKAEVSRVSLEDERFLRECRERAIAKLAMKGCPFPEDRYNPIVDCSDKPLPRAEGD